MFCRSSSLLFKFSHYGENVLPILKRCCNQSLKTIPKGQRLYHVWNSYSKRKLFDLGSTVNTNPKFVRYKNGQLQNQRKFKIQSSQPRPPNENMGNSTLRTIWSPIRFTLLVSGGSFACAVIYYGEKNINPGGNISKFSRAIRRYIREIPIIGELMSLNLSTGRKVTLGIILINIMVFACWRVKSLQSIMMKYFLNSAEKTTKVSSMLFSAFSHMNFLHLFLNMYVLWSFSFPITHSYGPEEFTAFYLTAGVVASLAAMTHRIVIKSTVPALGASGAILGIIGAVAMQHPNERVQIAVIGDIFPHSFSISTGVKGIMAFDLLGLILGWRIFDHAAHLGGMLFGLWYAKYGHILLFKRNGYGDRVFRTWCFIKKKVAGKKT